MYNYWSYERGRLILMFWWHPRMWDLEWHTTPCCAFYASVGPFTFQLGFKYEESDEVNNPITIEPKHFWLGEKPLHVRVAEALGWKMDRWEWDPIIPPLYDTDWRAAGPLIEKYKINIGAPTPQDSPVWGSRPKDGDPALTTWYANSELERESFTSSTYREAESPLIAVCLVILALKEAGKLDA